MWGLLVSRRWRFGGRTRGLACQVFLEKLRVKSRPGYDYILKVVSAGGFPAYEKAHRARLVATFVPKLRIPADVVPLVVDFWAHVGFY